MYKIYTDTDFTTGDPVIHDVSADLVRNGTQGYICNQGGGIVKAAMSQNGTAYGQDITLNPGETISFTDMNISKIKMTWVSDTDYKIFVA